MLFKEERSLFVIYNSGDILGLHKYIYYGDLDKFKSLITRDLIKQYQESIYFCIDYGCKRNFEFAEYIHKNVEFIDIRYKMSITATYIRNGKYDNSLYIDKFDYSQYRHIKKEKVYPLIKYTKLHNILLFVAILNSFELPITANYLYPINKLKSRYNIPNNSESKKLTDYSSFIFSKHKYSRTDLDIYSFSNPPGDFEHICNLEREILRLYLDKDYKEDKQLCPINKINIMNDIRFAIEGFSNKKFMNYCLSKFILVAPKMSIPLVLKHKPFLIFGNTPIDFYYLNEYIAINHLYRHNFIYSAIMYHCTGIEPYIGKEIDYCYIEACLKSCNFTILNLLKKLNKKCYKRVDYENEKYIESPEEIYLYYDIIAKESRLDLNEFRYI
uniref:Uncharacterized protein n=1 Tax=Debaryomyces robertsiae TaxID=28555 RepID=Q707W0_9ASCO|nr:hypothetical protein [Debaryomyces robertsiae]